jgi:NitT/TauT family transport system substrate-binding protein
VHKKHFKLFSLFLAMLFLLTLLSGCSNLDSSKREINIAIQYGLAYAPLEIMKEEGILEEYLPDDVTVNWIQVDGPTNIREGMLAGEIDIGFMGPAPAIIGLDNGMDWKIFTGLSFNEVAIVTNRDYIHTLADFTEDDRIAILSPGCTQHVLLAMACEQEFGDPNYFENQLVSMSHPDAMTALISGEEIAAHIATPPYIQEELEQGMHIVLTGEEIMGMSFTFIVGTGMTDFYENEPELFEAFEEALNDTIDYLNNDTEDALPLLSEIYDLSEEDLLSQITYGDSTIYSTELVGVEEFAEAMYRMGFTDSLPDLDSVIVTENESQ